MRSLISDLFKFAGDVASVDSCAARARGEEPGQHAHRCRFACKVIMISVRVICTYDDDQHVGEYEHEDGDQHVAYIFSMHVSSSLLLSCLLRCDPGER